MTPRNESHVIWYGSLLGIGNLTKGERRHLERKLRKLFPVDDGNTLDELVSCGSGWAAFIGGEPCAVCPDVNCPSRTSSQPMKFFLEMIPDEHDPWYDAAAGGDMGRVMVEICEAYRLVTISNLCT